MMKKIFALVLVGMLALGVASASADAQKYQMIEDFPAFDVTIDIPDGYTFKQNPEEGWLCLEMEAEGKPSFDINVAPSELVDELSLADMDETMKGDLQTAALDDFSAPEQEFFTTPSGNMILLTKETDPGAGGYATMVTVYKGFFFNMSRWYPDSRAFNDDDMKLMNQVVEGVWIVGADAAK